MSKFYSIFASLLLLLLVSCNETGVSASTTPEQTIADIAIEQDITPQDAVDTLNARGCVASTSMTVSEFQDSNPGVLFELADGGYYYDFTKCGTELTSSETNVSSSSSDGTSSSSDVSSMSSSVATSVAETPNLIEVSDEEWQTLRYPSDSTHFLYSLYTDETPNPYISYIKLTHLDNDGITWEAGDLITYNYTSGLISLNKDIMYNAPGGETLDSTHTRVEWTCYNKQKPFITSGDGNDSITMYFVQNTTDSINSGSIEILMNQDVSKEMVLSTRIFNSNAAGKLNYTYKYTFAINDMMSIGLPDSISTAAEAIDLGYPSAIDGVFSGRTLDSFTIRFTGNENQLAIRLTAIKLH